jgi:hypothetical protein
VGETPVTDPALAQGQLAQLDEAREMGQAVIADLRVENG